MGQIFMTGCFRRYLMHLPGLSSIKPSQGRLLRKPRMPPAAFPPPLASSAMTQSFVSTSSHCSLAGVAKLQQMSPPPPTTDTFCMQHSEQCDMSRPTTQKTFGNVINKEDISRATTQKTVSNYIKRDDHRFTLDPVYRDKTALGTYVEGNPLLKPYKPRGPDPLPARLPRTHPSIIRAINDEDEYDRDYHHVEFTLQDFLLKVAERENLALHRVQQVMLSKHNYKKLLKLLKEQCLSPRKTELNTVDLSLPDDIPTVTPRVPQKQLLIEMAVLVKQEMSQVMQREMTPVIRSLPKYTPNYEPGSTPHTEIVMYQDSPWDEEKELLDLMQETEVPGKSSIFHSATSRYFQGSRRTGSPFSLAGDAMINPSELAVLDSLSNGGRALSLKAHFIYQLPDIEPLTKTITYLNLSFNDFRTIPLEIFDIIQLSILKLRNNPIENIPADISKLKNLRVLVFSFCLVSTLPPSLFCLQNLKHLDCSFNKLSYFPPDIINLRKLRQLNVEGNQFAGLPAASMRMTSLRHVRVSNNYMHPLFWAEHNKNDPQRLFDLAGLCMIQNQLVEKYTGIPDNIKNILQSTSDCDCCGGPLCGPGLKILRPVRKIFGIKNLPFLFRCCAPYCQRMFMSEAESLVESLYGTPSPSQQPPE